MLNGEHPASLQRVPAKRKWWRRKRTILLAAFATVMLLPEFAVMPVLNATSRDWNAASFWYEPWGRSGVHKGIDIFAHRGTAVVAPTYGIVVFRGDLRMGGRVAVVLGPKWRLHYFAHLDEVHV